MLRSLMMTRIGLGALVTVSKPNIRLPIPMRLLTLINAVTRFKSFVFDEVFLTDRNETLVIGVRPRRRSRPVCSSCLAKGPT